MMPSAGNNNTIVVVTKTKLGALDWRHMHEEEKMVGARQGPQDLFIKITKGKGNNALDLFNSSYV
jgi:hypothetical protein